MILHTVVLVLGLLGANSYPQRRQLILVPAHEIFHQRIQEPMLQDNNLYLYSNHLPQRQGYVPQNGLVYLQDGTTEPPEQPGYFETIYAYLTGNSVTQQPPITTQSTSTEGSEPEPVPEDPKPTIESESESSTNIEATTLQPENKDDSKPIKIQQDDSKIEQLEPDAEIIPDTIKTNNKQPDVPLVPYPLNPGFIPGQRFYILNNNPGIVYPNPQIRPQPTLRYPGFQQRFLILGQPNIQQNPIQPNFVQSGQYLIGNTNELRSRQSQRLQVPPLNFINNMFGRQIQQPNFNVYNAVSEEGSSVISSQEQEGDITENNYAPLIRAHYGFSQNSEPTAGKSALEYTKYLHETSDDTRTQFSLTYNSKSNNDNNDSDSVTVDATTDDEEDKKKIELDHKDLNTDPGLARADPHAIALSGKGGTAQSNPVGTAIVGPSGIAVSDPIATALAGPLAKKPSNN